MDPDAETLLSHIRTAFSGVPRGPLSIHQAHIAKWADNERLKQASQLDSDSHWHEIDDVTIVDAKNAIYGADPDSWRYFVPAFMSWTVRHVRQTAAFLVDQTIYSFEPKAVGQPGRQEQVLRFETLSTKQKQCICEFLRYMTAFPDDCDAVVAQRAIEGYWHQF